MATFPLSYTLVKLANTFTRSKYPAGRPPHCIPLPLSALAFSHLFKYQYRVLTLLLARVPSNKLETATQTVANIDNRLCLYSSRHEEQNARSSWCWSDSDKVKHEGYLFRSLILRYAKKIPFQDLTAILKANQTSVNYLWPISVPISWRISWKLQIE